MTTEPSKETQDQEMLLEEKYKDHVKIHEYLFHEIPEYYSVFLSHPDGDFQRNLNVLMRDLVNGAFGNKPNEDPYSTYLRVTTPKNMAGLAEWVVGPHQTLMYFNKAYYLNTPDKSEHTCAISQVNAMQHYQWGQCYQAKELWLPSKLLHKEKMESLLRCVVSDMIARHLVSKHRAHTLRISINVPTLLKDNGNMYVPPVPEIIIEGTKIQPYVTMGTLIRTQKNSDVANRWVDGWDPYGIQAIGLRPSDAYNMPDAAVTLVANMCMFFDRQHFKSHHIKTKINKEDAIKEARAYLYYEFMNRNSTTYLFLIDHNPIGMIEYACYKDGPVHINKFFVLKEYRKKGYGTWIMKRILSDTFNIEYCLPYQTLKIYGSSAPKLLPFYGRFGFCPATIEGELTLTNEQIKELQSQLN